MNWLYAKKRFFTTEPHKIEASDTLPPSQRLAWVVPVHPMMHESDLARLKEALRQLEKEHNTDDYVAFAVKLATEAFADQEAFNAILGTTKIHSGRLLEVIRSICSWEMPVSFIIGSLAKELLKEFGSIAVVRKQLDACQECDFLKQTLLRECKSLAKETHSDARSKDVQFCVQKTAQ